MILDNVSEKESEKGILYYRPTVRAEEDEEESFKIHFEEKEKKK